MIQEAIIDAVLDSAKLLPFLYITYVLMEYLEHHTESKTKMIVQQAGRLGPVFGGILGVVPQCGFSAAAASLYAGRVITAGTLIAIFLSTSDEMLPIMISEAAPVSLILRILLTKMVYGIIAGLLIDVVVQGRHKYHAMQTKHDAETENPFTIKEICEHDHCNCKDGIFLSAFKHTSEVFVFILTVSAILNIVIGTIGEEALAQFILHQPFLGEVLAGIIGLIPNCAASVVLTQLYIQGAMSYSAMMAGLLVGAGVGLLVLFRVGQDLKKNLLVLLLLYVSGVAGGLLIHLINSFL
ncbi:MAG: arsenic efflux protein [Lachnospiraceae bacterium]|nr:arsenic efflux protein [Lachnospiraceae bacterium]